MIIHWNAKDAGPTSQMIGFTFQTFTSGALAVISVTRKPVRLFIQNVNRMGLR